MRYMCRQYGVHKVAVGSQQTADDVRNVVQELSSTEISVFFTNSHRVCYAISP